MVQAVILAGGLGTRLRPVTALMPKAMVPVNGKPFLEYELDLLKRNGIDDTVLCIGYFGERIQEHFGDGSAFGIRIMYSPDGKSPLGPIGALKMAEPLLEDAFFVTYGDAYLRLDYGFLMRTLLESGKLGAMAVYRNHDQFGKSDIVVRNGEVVEYSKKERKPGMVWINYGITALRKASLSRVRGGEFCDEESFYGDLVRERQLNSFEVTERFYEIGSPKSLAEFERFIAKKIEKGGWRNERV